MLDGLRARIGAPTVERLVELSRANVRDQQQAARAAARKNDLRGLSVAFHSIKGSAQLVGARRLEEVAGHWEQRARSGEVDMAAFEEVAAAFSRVERALDPPVEPESP